MRRFYQNVKIDGLNMSYENRHREKSEYWNEGKWNNFIAPLLPKERGTFIEIGCNAGLFLKMATDAGFREVIGVDGNPQIMEQAKCFKKANGGKYRLIEKTVGLDLDVAQLPAADVVLIANVHYHIPLVNFMDLVDQLKSRTRYCIIVSARVARRPANALHYLDSPGVRGMFSAWEEDKVVGDWRGVKKIEELIAGGDPAPRPQMYGVSFKGDLDVANVESVYKIASETASRSRHYRHLALFPVLEDFFPRVLAGESLDLEKTSFFKYWQKRSPKQSSKWIRGRLEAKKSLVEDIQKYGMRRPIYLADKDKIIDGAHRLIIARSQGHENILVRRF